MTLHRKIVVLLFAGITLYTVVGFLFNQFLILPSFQALEREEARKDMRRCLESVEGQIDRIDLLCFDWAAWDDTYEFIEEQNEDYRDSNLIPESFIDNGINFMYFFKVDGTLVWGAFYDLQEEIILPFHDFEDRSWTGGERLLAHPGRSSKVKGIISSSRGPLLISSRPILPSEAEDGEVVRGTLIMGRVLDDQTKALIQERTQVSVDLLDAVNDAPPPGAGGLKTDEIRIIEVSPVMLRVLSHLHDIDGKDAVLLHLTIPRTILARGKSATRLNMLAVGIAGFIFLLMLLFSLKWVVTDPLGRLSEHVNQVGLAEGISPPDLLRRKDEIGDLAREFDTMLKRLHEEEAELVTAEAALRTSEARVRTILNTAPDAILTIRADGIIESANNSASKLFGYSVDELQSKRAAELIAPGYREAWASLLSRDWNSSQDFTFVSDEESTGVKKDGATFPIHLSMSSLRLEGELYFICDIRDISGLKSMREKIARSQHLATIGEMGASVAHEIRNPLAGIKGALQVFVGGSLKPEESKEIAGAIAELVERIAHTVDQLLNYAKPITPKLDTLNVLTLLESISTQTPDGSQLSIDCPPDLELQADGRLLQQVLENIWRNACQALALRGQLTWRASSDGDCVLLELQNDGEPVPESDLSHVFDPFFTTKVDGSGLGLSISLRIIEAHGGTMALGNIGKRGTFVRIRMPLGV